MPRKTTKMTFTRACDVIGSGRRNPFGQTSKMPGYSYGLDAQQCRRGGELAKVRGSICNAHCYAKRNFYATWGPVITNRTRHQEAIGHPEWVSAMVHLMAKLIPPGRGQQYFRWLDSGDLPDYDALVKIVVVCDRTPWIRHWMPTREYDLVDRYLREVGSFPPNLVVRLSADMVGERPVVPAGVVDVPTSTVHRDGDGPVQVSTSRKHSVACRSAERDHVCGSCRACWSPGVRNVSYSLTDGKRRPAALRVLP